MFIDWLGVIVVVNVQAPSDSAGEHYILIKIMLFYSKNAAEQHTMITSPPPLQPQHFQHVLKESTNPNCFDLFRTDILYF